jgi:hypothetical protein
MVQNPKQEKNFSPMDVYIIYLPIRGLSEVIGMIEDTVFKNIVRESRMVTPVINLSYQNY